MARVLFLTLVYEPDTVSTATMVTEIAKGLHAVGHQVTVLTTTPHYNPAQVYRAHPAYSAGLGRPYKEVSENGVRVFRILMPLKRQRVWSRLLHYIWFQAFIVVLCWSKNLSCDVIFVPSPPIMLGLNGILLARLMKAKFIYDVRELWPDAPVRLGLIRNRLLVGAIYGLEALVYRHAAAISTVARSFSESLIRRGVPCSKLYWTPNFVDVDWIRPGGKANRFSEEHHLVHAFVILYAGNIGLTQGLEILVEVARCLREDPSVQIVVVGDGAGRSKLEKAIADSGLRNICRLPFQPEDQVPQTYATADVCVVLQRSGFSYVSVPSKMYTCMAAGRPVVVTAEEDTEAAALLRDTEAGIRVPPGSVSELVNAIRRLQSDPALRETLGARGRAWVVERYSREAVLPLYDQMIRDVVSGKRGWVPRLA